MITAKEFLVTASDVMIEDIGKVTVYGIAIQTAAGRTAVYDISTARRTVERLCDRLRQHDLSPLHLRDVVEDFLCE